jgi:uncharacterized protein YqeY
MTLREQLNADLRDALRAGEETRKSTLRLLLTAVRNAEIPPEFGADDQAPSTSRQELSDDAVRDLIRREVKQRRDSIDAYKKANREDLAAKEAAEIEVLATYLPQQMTRDEIAAVARDVIARIGARGPADKGKVMPVVIGELRDRAEGREINAVVTELLAEMGP